MRTLRATIISFAITILVMSLGGCAKLAHLDELLTLKGLSDNQAAQEAYVKKQDKKFETLLLALKDNGLKLNSLKDDCINRFGDPIYCRPTSDNGQSLERCLFRRALRQEAKEKVYLYFDRQGQLVDIQAKTSDP